MKHIEFYFFVKDDDKFVNCKDEKAAVAKGETTGKPVYIMLPRVEIEKIRERLRGYKKKIQAQEEINDRLYKKLHGGADERDPEAPIMVNVAKQKKGKTKFVAQVHYPLPMPPEPMLYEKALLTAEARWGDIKKIDRVYLHQQHGWLAVVLEDVKTEAERKREEQLQKEAARFVYR